MVGRPWVALGLLVLAGSLLVSCGGDSGEAPEATAPPGLEAQVPGTPWEGFEETEETSPVVRNGAGMAVDAVPGGAVDATATVTGTSSFDVDVVMDKAVSGYQGYQYKLQWDPAVLAYDGQKDLKPAQMVLCANPTTTESTVYTGCIRVSEDTTYTGPINTVTFRCIASGTSPLHLVSLTEEWDFGSTAIGYAGVTIETSLVDASVTCQ